MNSTMKWRTVVVLLLVLVFLAACRPQPQTRDAAQFLPEFRVGTQGLAMRFVPNLPPPRVFSGETLGVMIELENRGTYTVGGPGDKVYLSGFDPTIIAGISTFGEQIPVLEGRSQYVPQGGFGTIGFEGITRVLNNRYPVVLVANACYGYETVAAANVCIDPSPFSATVRQKVCVPQNVPLGGGQGAPVAVSLAELQPSPGTTRFKIHVQNVGGGEVFRAGTTHLAKCSPYTEGLAFDEIDYVELADVLISGVSIKHTCKPLDKGHIRLTNGQGMVFCELSVPRSAAAYVTPLTVVLRYGYRDTIVQPIEVLPTI